MPSVAVCLAYLARPTLWERLYLGLRLIVDRPLRDGPRDLRVLHRGGHVFGLTGKSSAHELHADVLTLRNLHSGKGRRDDPSVLWAEQAMSRAGESDVLEWAGLLPIGTTASPRLSYRDALALIGQDRPEASEY